MKTAKKTPSISLQELYVLLNLHAEPDRRTASRTFTHLSAHSDATPDSIVFATDAASLTAADALANTALFTSTLESWIHRYPEQWLWVHRRWKTRPEGEPSLY